MPTCKKCQVVKDEESFYWHRVGERNKTCKRCYLDSRKEYFKMRKSGLRVESSGYEQRRRNAQRERAVTLFGSRCSDCAGEFPACVYDFHHSDPSTKRKLAKGAKLSQNRGVNFTRSWENIKQELEKCIMLCSNCHRIRHSKWIFPSKQVKPIPPVAVPTQLSIPLMPREPTQYMEPIGAGMVGS